METNQIISPDGKFLGVQWPVWEVVGWLGNAAFFSRFLVQWRATEKRGQVVVPALFWWLSLAGSLLLLSYAILDKKRPRHRLCLRVHLDPLHPQPHDPSPPPEFPPSVSRMRRPGPLRTRIIAAIAAPNSFKRPIAVEK